MWKDMEDARIAAAQAQRLSAHCKQMCAESKEGTSKMHKDIVQSIELRIRDEEFWIEELEQRVGAIKQLVEEAEAMKNRLKKSIGICDEHRAITEECMAHRWKTFKCVDMEMKALEQEAQAFKQSSAVCIEAIETWNQRLRATQHSCTMLETDLSNKYLAIKKDKQSLDLRIHSPILQILASEDESNKRQGSSAMHPVGGRRQRNNPSWKAASNDNIKHAEAQICLSRKTLDETESVLNRMTCDLATLTSNVTAALQQHSQLLQQQKHDLEKHLVMVDSHIDATEESELQLQKAIEEKQRAILMTRGRMQLHKSRPKSELGSDHVQMVLEKELVEAEADLQVMRQQQPHLRKTVRSLRRSRLQIMDTVSEKTSCIETEELRCIAIRAAMSTIRL